MRSTRTILRALCAALIALALVPSAASAIARDQVIARGNVWVVKNVPYSQSRYAYVNGSLVPTSTASPSTVGYRTDCSGFVSMCWNLRYADGKPKNLDTSGLDSASVSVPITKAQLETGDLMLRAKDKVPNGSGHAVIFVKWADATRTGYWSYEERGTGYGTVTLLRNYDNDYTKSLFRPYRHVAIAPEFADVLEPVSGLNRYETAAAAVEKSFPTSTTVSVPAVIVASGETWPDALGAAALAGAHGGPLLLTARDSLPPATRSAIKRLKPKKVFVLGSPAAVSTVVQSQITSMGVPVTRIGGDDRYEVSKAVARAAVAQARARNLTVNTAYLASGLNFPDALAASPISTKTRRPILLTGKDSLPEGMLTTIKELGITNIVILGGTAVVSDSIASKLTAAGIKVSRIDGRDRYEVAVNVARHGAALGVGLSWKSLGLASGEAFADGLSGGVAQGQSSTGALLLLTRGDRLTDSVSKELYAHRKAIVRLRVFGGSSTVGQTTRAAAAAVLRTP